ncbi:MAG: efflux RND transporter permease subunit [Marinilabiliaceae bacterium]
MENQSQTKNGQNEGKGIMEFMARNSVAANLLMIILLAGGVWTMYNMQKEVFPDFQLDIVDVSVVYPGAAPAEVEYGILMPVEEAVRGVQGIEEVTSTAREGSGHVQIELVPGTERMKAFQDIQQAVNRIRTFPDDIEEPEVVLQARQRNVMEVGIYGDVDIWTLRVLAEQLRDQLINSRSITQVEIGNVPDMVTHVEIPRYTLREYNLTLSEVADIIARSSEDIPAGALETGSGEILLRMKERKQWAREFEKIGIISSETGGTVTLGEIAEVTDGFEETGFHGEFNEQPTVDLSIYRVGDQSPLDIAEEVQTILADFENTLPPGVQYRIDSNQAEDYRERLSLLTGNGLLAVVIVLLILALFLEYRLAFWVMMGMTVSFVGGIVFLPPLGISINMISMFGFLVALGIVVDDAIVVGENIYEYRQQGMGVMEAAIKGSKDIARPVVFSILTNIIAFIPLLFIPGETGKFWWPLPVVVITVLAVSLFEALLILPAHLGHTRYKTEKGIWAHVERVRKAFGRRFDHFIDHKYRPFLDFTLRNRYITLSVAIGLFIVVGGYGYSDHMGIIMMPEVSADEIEAGVRLPVGVTPEQAEQVARDITRSTRKMFEEHDLYEVAEGVKTNVRGQSFIDVEIVMKPPDQRDMTGRELIVLWRDEIGDIPGVDQITFQAERGPGGWAPDISVDISHSDIEVLEKASMDFLAEAESFEVTKDVNDNYDAGKMQFDFKLLPEGRRLGLTSSEVGRQVRNAFYGALAMRQLREVNEVEMRVKLPYEQRAELHNLEDFIVRTPNGQEVPLYEVARPESGEAFTSINRRDGRRVVTVSMNVEPETAISQVVSSMKNEVLPGIRNDYPGTTWSFEGSQADMRESTEVLYSGFMMAMLVMYALLAMAFGNYVQPLIVMFAIPFGIVGAVIGHILLGHDLSLVSLMGIIALSGVVVNDSLIMVHYANRRREALSAFDAIHEAGLRRFRPIMLTTFTTFGGLTPIILETSRQAYHLIPMAISLGFGILFATAIILVIVPCFYMVLEDLRVKVVGNGG